MKNGRYTKVFGKREIQLKNWTRTRSSESNCLLQPGQVTQREGQECLGSVVLGELAAHRASWLGQQGSLLLFVASQKCAQCEMSQTSCYLWSILWNFSCVYNQSSFPYLDLNFCPIYELGEAEVLTWVFTHETVPSSALSPKRCSLDMWFGFRWRRKGLPSLLFACFSVPKSTTDHVSRWAGMLFQLSLKI